MFSIVQQFEPTNLTAKAFYPMIVKKLKQGPVESEDSTDEEEQIDDAVDFNNDSGIDAKDKNSDESSSDDSEEEDDDGLPQPTSLQNATKNMTMIEAQREIIRRIRASVIPPKKENISESKEEKK